MYCADHLIMEQVREALVAELGDDAPAMSTLWRWSNKYDWFTKRDEIAKALADIAADTVLARAKMLRQVVDTGDPQCAFGVASLESLALKQAEAKKAGRVLEAQEAAAEQFREDGEPKDMVAALRDAVTMKLDAMLLDSAAFSIKDIKAVKEGFELLGEIERQLGSGRAEDVAEESKSEARRAIRNMLGYK